MANVVRKWRRIMAQGCSHGHHANRKILNQILKFKGTWKPDISVELGDLVDTTPYRTGASIAELASDPAIDLMAGVRWIEQYEPTHIAWGNHDWRVQELMSSPNAILTDSAKNFWGKLQGAARAAGARTVPYDFEKGWHEIGGTAWGHGYWYGEHAVRDTAEFLGMPTVMAHLHYAHEAQGRTRAYTKSFCTGTGADIPALHYARRRRATSRWSHGFVFGEVCKNESKLWLVSCEPGGELRVPFTI